MSWGECYWSVGGTGVCVCVCGVCVCVLYVCVCVCTSAGRKAVKSGNISN